jgi:hypothetical protein
VVVKSWAEISNDGISSTRLVRHGIFKIPSISYDLYGLSFHGLQIEV